MKRRITLVVDDDKRKAEGLPPMFSSTHAHLAPSSYGWTGVTVESDEVIPDPDRVQEFTVRIVTKATEPAYTANQVGWLIRSLRPEDITVTEVQS